MLAAELVVHIRSLRLACQPTSQQYYSLILNQHQPPATSQSAVLFSHNKSAPATTKRTQQLSGGEAPRSADWGHLVERAFRKKTIYQSC